MATNNLYLVTLVGTYFSQEVVNAFTYLQVSDDPTGDGAAEDLGEIFEDEFFGTNFADWDDIFSVDMHWTGLRVVNLFNDFDFYDTVFETPYVGASATQGLPPQVALTFRTNWLGPGIRRGFKRFCGMTEAYNANGALDPSGDTAAAFLASLLGSNLTDGTGIWSPVICKRIRTPVVDTNPQQYRYRLPDSIAEMNIVDTGEWSFVSNFGSQNSRKFGRGS